MFGQTIYERMRLYDIEADSFKIERENSVDGGETWAVMQKLAYTRKSDSTQSEEADLDDPDRFSPNYVMDSLFPNVMGC